MFLHFFTLLPVRQEPGLGPFHKFKFRAAVIAEPVIESGLFQRFFTAGTGGLGTTVNQLRNIKVKVAQAAGAQRLCTTPDSCEACRFTANGTPRIPGHQWKTFLLPGSLILSFSPGKQLFQPANHNITPPPLMVLKISVQPGESDRRQGDTHDRPDLLFQ